MRDAVAGRLPGRATELVLYVLAGLGAAASDSEPEIITLYRAHPLASVRQQAAWALARVVAPTRDVVRCKRCEDWIRDCDAHDTDTSVCERALALLAISRGAQFHEPEGILIRGSADQLDALAEAITAGWFESPVALEAFRTRLEAVRAQPTRPWNLPPRYVFGAPAMAETLWTAGARDPAVAAPLLRHWDAARRLAGLAALADSPAWTDRAAIAACLSDPDRVVRERALAIVRGRGDSALPLPRLRRAAAEPADPAFAAACAAAADALLAALTKDVDAATRDLLVSADAMLRGGPGPVAEPSDAPSREALLEFVRGSRGLDARVLEAFAAAGPSLAAEADGAEAFVAWLWADTAGAWRDAADALAHCGPALLRFEPPLETLLIESGNDAGRAFATGMEVRAGASVDTAALAAAEAEGPWHVTVRAWLERVRRGEPVPKATVRQARALAVRRDARVDQREDWGEARDGAHRGVDLAFDEELTRAAAVLLLAAAGESGWRGEVPPATGDRIADAVVAHRLPELATEWRERLRALCLDRH